MITYSKINTRIWSMLGTRRVIGVAISELADQDEKFTFVTADVGRYYAINKFKEKHSNKLINVGIAEQNMIGVAAAMAKEGFHVFTATYATFATGRVLDQVRVNMGLMGLPIKLIGVSAGLAEGEMSATHMALEDISMLRSIPNIIIVSPADCTEAMKIFEAANEIQQPMYIRLTGGLSSPIVYKEDYEFKIGHSITLQSGSDIAIIASGSMVAQSISVAKELEEQKISCSVIDMHTIWPLDIDTLDLLADTHKMLVTVEEHSVYGGLGGAVSEYFSIKSNRLPILKIGVNGIYPDADTYKNLLEKTGLSVSKITEKIEKNYKEI